MSSSKWSKEYKSLLKILSLLIIMKWHQFFIKIVSVSNCLIAKLFPPLVTPWTVAHKSPLSMKFSMQEYWSGLPFSTLGIFLTQGWNPYLLKLLHCRRFLYPWATREVLTLCLELLEELYILHLIFQITLTLLIMKMWKLRNRELASYLYSIKMRNKSIIKNGWWP